MEIGYLMKKNIPYKNRLLFTLSLLLAYTSLLSITTKELQKNASFNINGELQILNRHTEGGRSSVSFYKDNAENKYVLKINDNSEAAIQETVASHIGSSLNLPVNKVKILPANTEPFNNDAIATLHTVVPGIEIALNNNLHNDIDILDGLTQESFETLKKWPALILIVALDIFVGNPDRHNYNLFFEKNIRGSDKFHAIDLDLAFPKALVNKSDIDHFFTTIRKKSLQNKISTIFDAVSNLYHENVAERAYEFVIQLKKEKLSQQDYKVLLSLYNTLQLLREHYKPRKVYSLWMNYAKQAGYNYCPQKKAYIASLIAYNHYRVYKLIKELEILLEK